VKWRTLIACPHLQRTIARHEECFAEHRIEIEVPGRTEPYSARELIEIVPSFDGVIAGDDEFSAAVLERATRLKVIVKWGVGVDAIDLEAARRLGIRVFNTPGVFAEEVADVVMGYVILLARQLHRLDREVRAGGWPKIEGISLQERTLGIIGLGSIGQAVARRGAALGMPLVGCEIAPLLPSFIVQTGLRVVELDEVLASADFVTLNCNFTPENRHLLGKREFDRMKRGVYLINTARGKLIDEQSLADALTSGTVAGAALDVFEEEPLPAESVLRRFENCIFGAHNASNTAEAVARVNELAIEALIAEFEAPGSRRDLTGGSGRDRMEVADA
jgi:D-3-phosphoglycerate dehydrogenase